MNCNPIKKIKTNIFFNGKKLIEKNNTAFEVRVIEPEKNIETIFEYLYQCPSCKYIIAELQYQHTKSRQCPGCKGDLIYFYAVKKEKIL
ncbi:MAG: hypothetical protein ACFFE4_00550 [Candidatus Thorarchaeota archaeon]